MLKVLRKHAKYFYILFFIVIISFVFWGVGTVDKTGSVEIIAEVGKYKITGEEYWKTYDRVYRFYREIYKDKFDEEMEKKLNLKENVLDSMINEHILIIAAKEMGISVSNEELQDAIAQEPAFMKNGVFDNTIYLNRLKLNRITPEAFEHSKHQELLINKMRRIIELSVDMTDIDTHVLKTAGNEKTEKMITQAMLNDKKERAVKSYIEGLKKYIKIKINKNFIT